jgi:two-component system sensor histidine kinase DegS
LNKIESTSTFNNKDYYYLVYYSKLRDTDSILKYIQSIESNKGLPVKLQARFNYFKAYYYRITQNDSLSFKYHSNALSIGKKLNDTLTILAALSGLSQSYNYEDDAPYRKDYLSELADEAEKFNNIKYKIVSELLQGNYYSFRNKNRRALANYNKILSFRFTRRDSSILLKALSNIGAIYNEDLRLYDSALYFYKKRLKIIDNNKAFQSSYNYFNSYLNLGSLFLNEGNLDKALQYTLKADSVPIVENELNRKSIIKQNLAIIYAEKEDYKSAYENFKGYFELTDSIKRRDLAEGIAKYENQELRIQNLESETKQLASEKRAEQNRNLLFGSLGLLLFGSITFILIQKNTKRKQKLAEQQKALESQKLATVLKEQELTSIDAMIEGQEKERQRIANDLHDDLGGLMATVKLNFNALKDRGSPELYNKTNTLIEEAYQKVRTVAHAKNSGVIAKQGLLKAVKNMADKISVSNKIQIEVLDHGLDQRLENSLELTLFRVIQELITNVIKHAEATEVTIHLTNHEDSINIMVEDNGKGFDPHQITITNAGMGISSIDKRVEHLDGKLTIESEINKGTTVIIDIPL